MERPSNLAEDLEAKATAVAGTFEDLFAQQHERLYRALYLIVGNTHEAEELMQDALLQALQRWDRIDDPAEYLYRPALNATHSRFRRLTLAAERTLDVATSSKRGPWSRAQRPGRLRLGLQSVCRSTAWGEGAER
jgi:DNA-directed RNA polymerase specialized sigma24 family protein